MLLHPGDWSLAQAFEQVHRSLPAGLVDHTAGETNGAALELRTGVHRTAAQIASELRAPRGRLGPELTQMGLAAACCGLHPFAVWQDTMVRRSGRYGEVYRSMRALAQREPSWRRSPSSRATARPIASARSPAATASPRWCVRRRRASAGYRRCSRRIRAAAADARRTCDRPAR